MNYKTLRVLYVPIWSRTPSLYGPLAFVFSSSLIITLSWPYLLGLQYCYCRQNSHRSYSTVPIPVLYSYYRARARNIYFTFIITSNQQIHTSSSSSPSAPASAASHSSQSLRPKHGRVLQHLGDGKEPHVGSSDVNLLEMRHSASSRSDGHVSNLHVHVILRWVSMVV